MKIWNWFWNYDLYKIPWLPTRPRSGHQILKFRLAFNYELSDVTYLTSWEVRSSNGQYVLKIFNILFASRIFRMFSQGLNMNLSKKICNLCFFLPHLRKKHSLKIIILICSAWSCFYSSIQLLMLIISQI